MIDWQARALKAEADLAALRSASFSVRAWWAGSTCNDCTPKGNYDASGWNGEGPREDGHEVDCGYARDIDKLSVLLDAWQAEAYIKRQMESK